MINLLLNYGADINLEDTYTPIHIMELYYVTKNKTELKKLEKFISLFKTIHLNEIISIKEYAKSNSLDIPNSLIASTALTNNYKLFTYNKKESISYIFTN